MQLLSVIIGGIFIGSTAIYTMYKINTKTIDKFYPYVISSCIIASILVINFYMPITILGPMIAVFGLALISKFILKFNIYISTLSAIFFEFICIISENIVALLLLLSNKNDLVEWYNSPTGMIFFNFVISIIIVLIVRLSITKKLYNRFIEFIDFLSHRTSLIVMIISFILVVILFYVVYYYYYANRFLVYITIVLMFAFYTFIMIVLLKTAGNYEKIKSKYTLSIENLKFYEEMLDQYRVANHENKNQLLLVRNLVKDKKVKDYIDELIDNKEKDDTNLYNSLKRIPDSSIRAVVYSKILLMNNKNINYSMNIDRKLSAKDFANISNNLLLDICNILNIFIDNAIDEVSKLDKKQILIEITKVNDEKIEITTSNTCNNTINLNEIYGMGYSTKGQNHGYGLPIVKNTIDNNRGILENKTEKMNGVFTQYLYIKTK